ncbi:MAG: STAG domain-containing protein [Deltaproteobacteria bacterium]|jgi:predicted transcriptional regulator|nr:STAG domain-containing protein [Deltaproteobacteria bacterium]
MPGQVRLQIAYQLVQDYCGIPLVEVARQLGVSMSAISRQLQGERKSKSS